MESKLPDDFAVFILTHGRPDNVLTLKTLQKCGYTGKVFFIVDNEDNTIDQYVKNFGRERVIVFRKKDVADMCDEGNNFDERRTILMARNACFDIAKVLGIKYFMQLDDDYYGFLFRFPSEMANTWQFKNMNRPLLSLLNFFKSTNALSIALSQGGDHIG